MFPTQNGRPPAPDRIGEWVRPALRKAGLWIPGRGPHAFRRTFATEFLRANPAQLRRLQLLMRHAFIVTTMLYDYADPEECRPALSNLRL